MFYRVKQWVKRHPILSVILAVWVALIILASVFGEAEDGSTGSLIGGASILILLGVLFSMLVGWIVDKRKGYRRSSSPVAVLAPASPAAFIASPVTSVPRPNSVNPAANNNNPATEEDSQPEESAFEETSQQQIPDIYRPGNMTLRDMLQMSPTEFEEFCGKALEGMGYKNMKRVGGSGDLAADLVGQDTHGRSTIVQCKRYKPGTKVGSPVVQTFIGMKNVHHGAERGIFMTTADYSRPAVQLAKQHDLVLIDGDDLVKIAGLVFIPKPKPSPTQSLPRFCANCGAEFPETSRFCPSCGQSRN